MASKGHDDKTRVGSSLKGPGGFFHTTLQLSLILS